MLTQNYLHLTISGLLFDGSEPVFSPAHGDARPLLGGTDISVRMRDGIWHDHYLVDVNDWTAVVNSTSIQQQV